eukprot:CAMPEP_0198247772 /NCGR_PEP_ID=MMETSP1446-20131203/46647_1 /TAXON_ID=1461542 ORGANISM="Unidentified sp, Strain CCMP2111" /NCGR_SAMPLE_ID=MMETSP1446 /ASSEMBLY_ACC=CAM_ASM_001112 /LENGTH=1138 /DNA_ID=CAMNT_0043932101 /DNA_START=70 /DNA_END=3486 /DNA_ORIENTATION=+
MKRGAALLLCICLWALVVPGPAAAQDSFDLTIVGAGISDWSFLDAYLAHAGHDIAFGNSGLAELVIRCEKGTKQTMQIPLPGVDVPDTWYDGLNHELGTWHPDAQQELFCEAWECDNILGCASENTVSAEPNAGLGDDYLGVTRITPYDFRGDPVKIFSFVSDGDVKVATSIRCDSCYAWAQNQILQNWEAKPPVSASPIPGSTPPPANNGTPQKPPTNGNSNGGTGSQPSPPPVQVPPPATVDGGNNNASPGTPSDKPKENGDDANAFESPTNPTTPPSVPPADDDYEPYYYDYENYDYEPYNDYYYTNKPPTVPQDDGGSNPGNVVAPPVLPPVVPPPSQESNSPPPSGNEPNSVDDTVVPPAPAPAPTPTPTPTPVAPPPPPPPQESLDEDYEYNYDYDYDYDYSYDYEAPLEDGSNPVDVISPPPAPVAPLPSVPQDTENSDSSPPSDDQSNSVDDIVVPPSPAPAPAPAPIAPVAPPQQTPDEDYDYEYDYEDYDYAYSYDYDYEVEPPVDDRSNAGDEVVPPAPPVTPPSNPDPTNNDVPSQPPAFSETPNGEDKESSDLIDVESSASAPVVTLLGNKTVYVYYGGEFNDPGAIAYDAVDGDITSTITAVGTVDTNVLGLQKIRYVATNSLGERGFKIRRVEVVPDVAVPFEDGHENVFPAPSGPADSPPIPQGTQEEDYDYESYYYDYGNYDYDYYSESPPPVPQESPNGGDTQSSPGATSPSGDSSNTGGSNTGGSNTGGSNAGGSNTGGSVVPPSNSDKTDETNANGDGSSGGGTNNNASNGGDSGSPADAPSPAPSSPNANTNSGSSSEKPTEGGTGANESGGNPNDSNSGDSETSPNPPAGPQSLWDVFFPPPPAPPATPAPPPPPAPAPSVGTNPNPDSQSEPQSTQTETNSPQTSVEQGGNGGLAPPFDANVGAFDDGTGTNPNIPTENTGQGGNAGNSGGSNTATPGQTGRQPGSGGLPNSRGTPTNRNGSRNNRGSSSNRGSNRGESAEQPAGDKKESKKKDDSATLIIAIVIPVLAVLLATSILCCCYCGKRKQMQTVLPTPAFKGPLRRIVVDSQNKRQGPGVTAPLQAYNTSGDNQLHYASRGDQLDAMRASAPREVARGFQDQLTGQPVRSLLPKWRPK